MKKKEQNKEENAEDYCFVCKDGGHLIICDYKQCLKSYHCGCVQKDPSFATSKEKWVCDWHSCRVCNKKSQIQCYCCPNATCWQCINIAGLVNIKGNYGFCSHCLKLALMVEDDKDADSDGEIVDFKDRETIEGLFMEYYKIIQKKEGISADNLRAASTRLKTGKNILSGSEADASGDDEEEEWNSDEDMDYKRTYKQLPKNKQSKKGLPVIRSVKSKRMKFCGWGSIPLIKFLKSIGNDTSKKLSQHEVYSIVCKYITSNNLHDPKKKKRIIFDEKLRLIFQKKTVNKNRIFGLLEAHFLENLDESEEELEYEDDTPLVTCKTKKLSEIEKGYPKKDTIPNVPHSCYASVTAENLKLVYLRKSVVYELSKERESFESKVKGSFVRVKSDPYDFFQRNSHQLVQVTGITFVSVEDNTEIILCVSKIPKEINISLLSDADFSKEECEDLRQKVNDGLLPKPTVVELQEKARNLHVDITKHWIARELKMLDVRIGLANEKGWRRELYEYLQRKKLLETPSEQARLLEDYPKVIPELADVEPEEQDMVDEQNPVESLPPSIFSVNPNDNSEDVVYLQPTIANTMDEQKGDEALPEPTFPTYPNEKSESDGISENEEHFAHPSSLEGNQNLDGTAIPVSPYYCPSMDKRDEPQQIHVTSPVDADRLSSASANPSKQRDGTTQTTSKKQKKPLAIEVIGLDSDTENQPNAEKKQKPLVGEVIELDSDDDHDQPRPNAAVEGQILEDPESQIWLMTGPNGRPRPSRYSLSLLKRWSEVTPYAFGFKVWKENQSQEEAIWLGDALNLAFPETRWVAPARSNSYSANI